MPPPALQSSLPKSFDCRSINDLTEYQQSKVRIWWASSDSNASRVERSCGLPKVPYLALCLKSPIRGHMERISRTLRARILLKTLKGTLGVL